MSTLITIGLEDRQRQMPPHTVYTREKWADSWTERVGLECTSCIFAAAPTMPEAQFLYRYGAGMRETEAFRSVVDPISIVGHYVMVVIDPDDDHDSLSLSARPWVGKVIESSDSREGSSPRPGSTVRVRRGVQSFVAWGIECELDCEIMSAFVETSSGDETEIGRPLGFNCGSSTSADLAGELTTPNRSLAVGSVNLAAYIFSSDLKESAESWTAGDIIEYLLVLHTARDPQGNRIIDWVLDDTTLIAMFDSRKPKLNAAGKTIRACLNELMDRRRGMSWYAKYDEQANGVEIIPFAFNDASVVLSGTETLPANADQVQLDFDLSPDVLSAEIREVRSIRAHQIVVRGSRRSAVCTFSVAAESWEDDWTGDLQAEYDAAATGQAGYADLARYLKEQHNDAYRQRESLRPVYSWWHLPVTWDDTADNAAYNGTTSYHEVTVPESETDPVQMNWTSYLPYWRPGLRFDSDLPLVVGIDYSDDAIATGFGPTDVIGDRVAPFVIIRTGEEGNPAKDRYAYIDQLAGDARNETAAGGRCWSGALKMRADDAGIEIRVHGGPQHLLAGEAYTAPDDTDVLPDLDYGNDLIATVALQTDWHIEAREPTDAVIAGDPSLEGVSIERCVIDVPDARLEYVVPQTVVGIEDGLLIASDGGITRDDRPRLRAIAKLAAEWYLQPRKTIQVTIGQIRNYVDLGQLVVAIGDEETEETIRTAITSIRYNLAQGQMTIATQFAELDIGIIETL